MKRFITVAMTLMALSYPLTVQAYNEAEEAGKRAIRNIEQADGLVNGEWDAIELNGLYVRLFDDITEAVEEQGKIDGYQIEEITCSDDGQYFSIKVVPTVYDVKEGDTLSKIAQDKKTTVKELLKLNPEISNPDLIYAGSTLRIK